MDRHRVDGHKDHNRWPWHLRLRPPSDEALNRLLIVLGPMLRRRAQVRAPRRAFVRALRSHLLTTGSGGARRISRTVSLGQRRPGVPAPQRAAPRRPPRAVVLLTRAVGILSVGALAAVAWGQLAVAILLLVVMILAVLIIVRSAERAGRPTHGG